MVYYDLNEWSWDCSWYQDLQLHNWHVSITVKWAKQIRCLIQWKFRIRRLISRHGMLWLEGLIKLQTPIGIWSFSIKWKKKGGIIMTINCLGEEGKLNENKKLVGSVQNRGLNKSGVKNACASWYLISMECMKESRNVHLLLMWEISTMLQLFWNYNQIISLKPLKIEKWRRKIWTFEHLLMRWPSWSKAPD